MLGLAGKSASVITIGIAIVAVPVSVCGTVSSAFVTVVIASMLPNMCGLAGEVTTITCSVTIVIKDVIAVTLLSAYITDLVCTRVVGVTRTVVALISTSGNVTLVITSISVQVIDLTCVVTSGGLTTCITCVMEDVIYLTSFAAFVTLTITCVIPCVSYLTDVFAQRVVTFSIASVVKYVVNCAYYLTAFAFTSGIANVSIYVLESYSNDAALYSIPTLGVALAHIILVCRTIYFVTRFIAFAIVNVIYATSETTTVVTVYITTVGEFMRSGTNQTTLIIVTNGIALIGEDVRSFSYVIAKLTVKVTTIGVNVSRAGCVTSANVTNCIARIGP